MVQLLIQNTRFFFPINTILSMVVNLTSRKCIPGLKDMLSSSVCYCFLIIEILTCRQVLFGLMTFCFIITAMLTTYFGIAIVAITKKNNGSSSEKIFNWNENEKQEILGIFFWGYASVKIPTGRIAETIGPRRVLGFSMFIAGLITLITPTIAFWNYHALLVSRILFGMSLGTIYPSFLPLVAKWFPPSSQSNFLTCMEAGSLGFTLTHLLGGLLISSYGWVSVFYVTGSLALLWSAACFLLLYDSPEVHPRISVQEKAEILNGFVSRNTTVARPKLKEIPWREILTSRAVWAVLAAQIACYNLTTILTTELPLYIHQVFRIELEFGGLYASIPFFGGYLSALISGYAAHKLYKAKTISTLRIRKTFETIGLLFPALCLIVVAFKGDDVVIATIFLVLILSLVGACIGGHYSNILDIAPNFSGTIAGLIYTISALVTYFITKLVALLLKEGQTFQEWRYLFWILCGINLIGWIVYVIIASVKLESWNLQDHTITTPENTLPDNTCSRRHVTN